MLPRDGACTARPNGTTCRTPTRCRCRAAIWSAHLRPRYYYLFHQPVATMKTTWGCWYKCNFCFTWRITDGATHSRSPESIADELAQIDCEHVYIVDDIFLIQPRG